MKFSSFNRDILYALDLDGVIIDSIHECYFIASTVFNNGVVNRKKEKELFFKYRGLVGPAAHFYFLLKIIHEHINGDEINIEKKYKRTIQRGDQSKSTEFEKNFYSLRIDYQTKKFNEWIKLNPLTSFGKHLLIQKPENIIILTAKNHFSASEILKYYNINFIKLFGIEQINNYGTKGTLLNEIFNKYNYKKIYFIDDHVENLESVSNEKIKCFFAAWGYGINTNYLEYN